MQNYTLLPLSCAQPEGKHTPFSKGNRFFSEQGILTVISSQASRNLLGYGTGTTPSLSRSVCKAIKDKRAILCSEFLLDCRPGIITRKTITSLEIIKAAGRKILKFCAILCLTIRYQRCTVVCNLGPGPVFMILALYPGCHYSICITRSNYFWAYQHDL